MIPGGELNFGVFLICLATLAKKLSFLYQTHSQLRSFRMKEQTNSISTVPGFAPAEVLVRSELPGGRGVSLCSLRLGGLCVGFICSGSTDLLPRRGHIQTQTEAPQNEHLHKIYGGVGTRIDSLYDCSKVKRTISAWVPKRRGGPQVPAPQLVKTSIRPKRLRPWT